MIDTIHYTSTVLSWYKIVGMVKNSEKSYVTTAKDRLQYLDTPGVFLPIKKF